MLQKQPGRRDGRQTRSLAEVPTHLQFDVGWPKTPERVLRAAILAAARIGPGRATERRPLGAQRVEQAWPTRDRRAFALLASGGVPLMYQGALPTRARTREALQLVDIYVDVSGSTWSFLPAIVEAVLSCQRLVRPVIWAFSTKVVPTTLDQLRRGRVESTVGTDGAAVTAHLCQRRSAAAVILTDGFVGNIPYPHQQACRDARLQVVLTPGGSDLNLRPFASAFHHLELP